MILFILVSRPLNMAEASFAIFGLTIIVVFALSLYISTVRSIRKRKESTHEVVLHKTRNLIIGIIVGIMLATFSLLDPVISALGVKPPWIIVPIVVLSYGFVISLSAVDLVVFQTSLRIKKFPVNENTKSFADGIIISIGYLLLIDLLFKVDPLTFKNCCS